MTNLFWFSLWDLRVGIFTTKRFVWFELLQLRNARAFWFWPVVIAWRRLS